MPFKIFIGRTFLLVFVIIGVISFFKLALMADNWSNKHIKHLPTQEEVDDLRHRVEELEKRGREIENH